MVEIRDTIIWEEYFPQSPTVFALRGDQYKYITYYGLWDAVELYDITNDPSESKNLLYDPQFRSVGRNMETRLYDMMKVVGGMEIPLNANRDRELPGQFSVAHTT